MKSFLFNPLPEGAGKPGAPDVDYWASATHSKTPRDGAAWLLKQYAVCYCLVPPVAVTYSPRTRGRTYEQLRQTGEAAIPPPHARVARRNLWKIFHKFLFTPAPLKE